MDNDDDGDTKFNEGGECIEDNKGRGDHPSCANSGDADDANDGREEAGRQYGTEDCLGARGCRRDEGIPIYCSLAADMWVKGRCVGGVIG